MQRGKRAITVKKGDSLDQACKRNTNGERNEEEGEGGSSWRMVDCYVAKSL